MALYVVDVVAVRFSAVGSFDVGCKGGILQMLAAKFSERRLHFFVDRLATLVNFPDTSLAALYLVDWGYNTAPERARAESLDTIEVINRERFDAIVNPA